MYTVLDITSSFPYLGEMTSALLPFMGKEKDLHLKCTPKMLYVYYLRKKTNKISIPRGAKRTELAEKGLIGKVLMNTAWNVDNVAREITSVFQIHLNLNLVNFYLLNIHLGCIINIPLLKFQFLISILLSICFCSYIFWYQKLAVF